MAIVSNLTVDQGSTFSASIDITDTEDNILTLTGYTVAGQIRKTYDSTISVDFSASVSNASTGEVTISLTPAQTNALVAGRNVYDVEITSAGGTVTRVIEGQLEVTPGVTQ